jgi:Ca2+-binding RTX toxin-like protein
LVAGNTASLDTIVVNGAAINLSAMVFQSWAVSDVVSLNGTAGTDTVTGSVQRDTIRGGAQADKLNGNGGNDTFEIAGTEGIGDIVEGGDGTDILQFIGAGIVTLDGFNAGTSSIERVNGNGEELRGTSAGDVFNLSALTSRSAFKIVDGRGGGDTITGTAFSDDLRGGTNNDTIRGDDGNDRLTGGNGRDLLTGGANAVIFDFNTFGESVVGANRDQILDFSRAQADRIDLSTIDAKTGIDGNQKFTFIGTQAFHGVKGELRFKISAPTASSKAT